MENVIDRHFNVTFHTSTEQALSHLGYLEDRDIDLTDINDRLTNLGYDFDRSLVRGFKAEGRDQPLFIVQTSGKVTDITEVLRIPTDDELKDFAYDSTPALFLQNAIFTSKETGECIDIFSLINTEENKVFYPAVAFSPEVAGDNAGILPLGATKIPKYLLTTPHTLFTTIHSWSTRVITALHEFRHLDPKNKSITKQIDRERDAVTQSLDFYDYVREKGIDLQDGLSPERAKQPYLSSLRVYEIGLDERVNFKPVKIFIIYLAGVLKYHFLHSK